ncbi:hypothetical protein [Paenibacillus sp. V4I7]|uniref:hypothetical protein n=1 Tax=Paenibacillus sp. V4I7 TaxID=3042307 RepID=UPI002784C4EB|nr:hypothetical protein [Paenibacillus sp. V4I7]MDQ0900340.1 hypothetical protein [Paenibacillus sp. V4I7]
MSATDLAGNTSNVTFTFQVSVTYDGVSELIRQFMADDQGIASELCSKFLNAQEAEKRGNQKAKEGMLHAFLNEVDALNGKKMTTEQAQILKKLAGYCNPIGG